MIMKGDVAIQKYLVFTRQVQMKWKLTWISLKKYWKKYFFVDNSYKKFCSQQYNINSTTENYF